jgi:hypothetical protein
MICQASCRLVRPTDPRIASVGGVRAPRGDFRGHYTHFRRLERIPHPAHLTPAAIRHSDPPQAGKFRHSFVILPAIVPTCWDDGGSVFPIGAHRQQGRISPFPPAASRPRLTPVRTRRYAFRNEPAPLRVAANRPRFCRFNPQSEIRTLQSLSPPSNAVSLSNARFFPPRLRHSGRPFPNPPSAISASSAVKAVPFRLSPFSPLPRLFLCQMRDLPAQNDLRASAGSYAHKGMHMAWMEKVRNRAQKPVKTAPKT